MLFTFIFQGRELWVTGFGLVRCGKQYHQKKKIETMAFLAQDSVRSKNRCE